MVVVVVVGIVVGVVVGVGAVARGVGSCRGGQ